MKKHMRYGAMALAAVLASTALTGCVRDELGDCPNLSVSFGVKDRLYSNAGDVAYTDPNESLPFDQLIPTMYCLLRDSEGNTVREMHLGKVSADGLINNIVFDENLPFGKYTLTAWGAIDDESQLGDDHTTLDLTGLDHDVFTASADIDYSWDSAEVRADFERATGLVIVETEWQTFPGGINASEKTFTGLSSTVSEGLEYEETQKITIDYNWASAASVKSSTVLPPSAKDNGTRLHIRYFDSENPTAPGVVPEDVTLTVRRNQITRLQYRFDPYSQSIIVSTMVDGRWQQINGMHVD